MDLDLRSDGFAVGTLFLPQAVEKRVFIRVIISGLDPDGDADAFGP